MKIADQKGDWIFISPIKGIELSEDIKGEITIRRVTFISSNKFKHARKRFNLPSNDKLSKDPKFSNFFNSHKTFAILKFKGKPSEKQLDCSKIIESELSILASSLLGWRTRKYATGISILSSKVINHKTNIYLKKGEIIGSLNNSIFTDPRPLIIDKEWKRFHSYFFFNKLIKVINQENDISPKWRELLERASVMIGKSQNSNDLAFCFLWNMIVIEMLLTDQGDKYSEKLPERIEAFLGWVGYWEEKNYSAKIKDLYAKRCAFVHDGNKKGISAEDLLFTDELVFNLMHNIVCNIKIFSSKQNIIDYSDKVKCEKVLGLKSKIQPKSLKFSSKEYNEEDIKGIQSNFV